MHRCQLAPRQAIESVPDQQLLERSSAKREEHAFTTLGHQSDRKKLESQILRAQRLESIGTVTGSIAHDLNNVLTPVLMALKLLKRNWPEAERQDLLATAQASVERGVEMIKQMLSFAGGVQRDRSTVQLKQVIAEVRALLEHVLPKSINCRVQTAAGLWFLSGDPTQMLQVFMNLGVNAQDAMPEAAVRNRSFVAP